MPPKNNFIFCWYVAMKIADIASALSLGKKVPERNLSRNRTHDGSATAQAINFGPLSGSHSSMRNADVPKFEPACEVIRPRGHDFGNEDFVGQICYRASKSFGRWLGRPLSSGFHFTPDFSKDQKFITPSTGGEMMEGAEEG